MVNGVGGVAEKVEGRRQPKKDGIHGESVIVKEIVHPLP